MVRLNIKLKLTLLFLVFGIVPLMIVIPITFGKLNDMQQATLDNMGSTASQIGELIDRNLFERYGDVQAFGTNAAAKDTSNWYKAGSGNPLIASMDAYMTNYGLYKVMMVVDMEGKVAAINSTDNKGKKLPVSEIYSKSFKNEEWFQKAKNKTFLKSDVLDGTVVEQPRYEPTVLEIYKSEDGFTITFAAPIYDYSGRMIGVWANFADFSLVEDIVKDVHKEKTTSGLKDIAFAIGDEKGTILVNYDPAARAELASRDPGSIGIKSLSDLEIPAANDAINSTSGTNIEKDIGSGEKDAVAWIRQMVHLVIRALTGL